MENLKKDAYDFGFKIEEIGRQLNKINSKIIPTLDRFIKYPNNFNQKGFLKSGMTKDELDLALNAETITTEKELQFKLVRQILIDLKEKYLVKYREYKNDVANLSNEWKRLHPTKNLNKEYKKCK